MEVAVMPFGLASAPATFQDLMSRIISEVKQSMAYRELKLTEETDIVVYVDYLGIGSFSKDAHWKVMNLICETLHKYSLRISLKKCQWCALRVKYLGFELDWSEEYGGIIRPQSEKLESLQSLEVKNIKDLRSFLGAANFFRRHLPQFTQRSSRLTDLLKKNVKWN